ncbi:MAG TPA: membrane protein insertion efficiency factor YidD [Gammaproteobacteria bacterium]|nr:membrane protein insertion efficiency factor YidD [Gammaproteobacteria bacterium]
MAIINSGILKLLRAYRYLVSPAYIPCCRFIPTCSEYAVDAYQSFGFCKATFLVLKRLTRCHPWAGFGFDEVPKREGFNE